MKNMSDQEVKNKFFHTRLNHNLCLNLRTESQFNYYAIRAKLLIKQKSHPTKSKTLQ